MVLQKQLQHGRLTEADPQAEAQSVRSPLGLVPRHDGGGRRIHEFSFPHGQSVNDGIPHDWGSLEYATYDDAVDALLSRGSGGQVVKRDLKDARHIPVATSNQWLLAFYCWCCYWIERYLPFSLRTVPFLIDLFAKVLNWDNFFAILFPNAFAYY